MIKFIPSGPNDIKIPYRRNINYLRNLVKRSSYCRQEFSVESRDIDPADMIFWGNGKKVDARSPSCHNCRNVFINRNTPLKGNAYIDDKQFLPLEKATVREASMDDAIEYVKITFHEMVCRGKYNVLHISPFGAECQTELTFRLNFSIYLPYPQEW